MTTDPDELSYLRIMIAKKRKKNSFWKWADRPVEERGIATEILRQGGVDVADMRSREQGKDPPDCEATLDGRGSGVEVTELIDQPSLERNLREPESPEYFDWDKTTFLAALQERIDAKDRAWNSGPYERRVLVIHTDEYELNRDIVSRFLEDVRFRATLITDAFLGLSYHPSAESGGGFYPIGRIYQTRGGPDSLRWFWSMNANGPMTRSDRVATLEEAKAQFQKSWECLEGVGEAGRGALISVMTLRGRRVCGNPHPAVQTSGTPLKPMFPTP